MDVVAQRKHRRLGPNEFDRAIKGDLKPRRGSRAPLVVPFQSRLVLGLAAGWIVTSAT